MREIDGLDLKLLDTNSDSEKIEAKAKDDGIGVQPLERPTHVPKEGNGGLDSVGPSETSHRSEIEDRFDY